VSQLGRLIRLKKEKARFYFYACNGQAGNGLNRYQKAFNWAEVD